jgi:NADH-quinone oxidoreductase subunit E
VALTEATRARAREIVARYPRPRSALLPMLHLVQAEDGYVTPEGVALCAEELGLTKAEVGAVATFYTMYKRRPTGEWLVSVCTNLSCQILGGEEVYACLSRHLGVGHDETTPDGQVTLEHAECLAACDYAPVMTVNYEFFDDVTPDSALEIVRALQRGDRPAPTRGEPLVAFREIEEQLAGFVPDAAVLAAVTNPAAAHPTPPEPHDSRGSVDTAGTDIAPPAGTGDDAVPGGRTEAAVSDSAAAQTWADPGAVHAAPTPAEPAGAAPAEAPAAAAPDAGPGGALEPTPEPTSGAAPDAAPGAAPAGPDGAPAVPGGAPDGEGG